jgi:hypothetical protein
MKSPRQNPFSQGAAWIWPLDRTPGVGGAGAGVFVIGQNTTSLTPNTPGRPTGYTNGAPIFDKKESTEEKQRTQREQEKRRRRGEKKEINKTFQGISPSRKGGGRGSEALECLIFIYITHRP